MSIPYAWQSKNLEINKFINASKALLLFVAPLQISIINNNSF